MFSRLPGELYSAIIQHLPDDEVQYTIWSLTRVLPYAPISQHHLFECVRLKLSKQALLFYRRLRQPTGSLPGPDACAWVRAIFIENWTVDADIVVNIVKLLPNLEVLNLWIGARNFSPEHLEDMFARPLPHLENLSLRFRP